MGYTLELRVGSVERIVQELREPTIDPATLDVQAGLDPDVDDVVSHWTDFATAAAAGVAAGGRSVEGSLATYVMLVVHHLTHWYGALAHTSSGGEDFRSRFLPGPASQVLGADLVRHLLSRELGGLTSEEYPLFGWASVRELQEVASRGLTVPEGAGVGVEAAAAADEDALWTLVDVVERAADKGLDLIAVYA